MEINEKLCLPENFKPDYKLLEIRDLSYSNIKRFSAKIIVSDNNYTNLAHQHIIKKIYEKYKPNAISIFGYFERNIDDIVDVELQKNEIEDYKYAATAGMSEFCPFGDWSRAGESENLEDFKFIIEF